MNTKRYFAYLDPALLTSVDDVAAALQKLDRALQASSLAPLQNFNRTYLIITQQVRRHLQQNGFNHKAFLEAFDIRFASYYFQALQAYLQGKPLAPAWQEAFEQCRHGGASPAMATALGVNAHINNDIPQVLRDLNAQNRHQADYRLVNRIIRRSLNEVLATLQDAPTIFNPKRRFLKLPAKLVMNWLMRRWRAAAWHRFGLLKSQAVTTQHVEAAAYRKARRLSYLPI